MTSTTAPEIVDIVAKKDYAETAADPKTGEIKETYRYDGIYHPINGQLKVFGLREPLGSVLYLLSQIPSFVFMILISFVSRNIM